MKAKHTPVPWRTQGTAGHETHGQVAIYGEDGKDVAIVYDGEANAEFIVRAVNNHDALVRAICGLLNDVSDLPDTARERFGGRADASVMNAIEALKNTIT